MPDRNTEGARTEALARVRAARIQLKIAEARAARCRDALRSELLIALGLGLTREALGGALGAQSGTHNAEAGETVREGQ